MVSMLVIELKIPRFWMAYRSGAIEAVESAQCLADIGWEVSIGWFQVSGSERLYIRC